MRLRTTPPGSFCLIALAAFLRPTLPQDGDLPSTSSFPFEAIVANDNQRPAGVLENGILTIRLEVRRGAWYPEAEGGPSLVVQAFGEADRPLEIPGPLIRVPQGTMIHATIRNALSDSTLVLYGLQTRPGSPAESVQVAPGRTREVRFRAGAPGTYYYWGTTTGSALGNRDGEDSQLAGAFIVDPPDQAVADRVFLIGLWFQAADSTGPQPKPEQEVMVINGMSWPHTERFTYTVGDSVRWRWINATAAPHPMHLHGFYYRVDSRGSWAADTIYAGPLRRLAATELMPIGGTMDVRWSPQRPGNWIFHCHFAFHVSQHLKLGRDEPEADHAARAEAVSHAAPPASAVHGMAGLVLGLHVLPPEERSPAAARGPATAREPRRLRLLVQSAPKRFGEAAGFGYVLQRGEAEPAPDSIEIPGSLLVLERGAPVAITVVNHLEEPTALHWHGIELESYPDGVPEWSGTPGHIAPPIAPRDSFTAEFTPPRAGTFIYHSHANELVQINSGLYGPLIVVEPGAKLDPDRDRLVMVGGGGPEGTEGFVNGSTEPPPLDLEVAVTYRLRLVSIHPTWRVLFLLFGKEGMAQWRAVAKDGAELPPEQATLRSAQLMTGPGETADFEFTPVVPGELWLEVASGRAGWHVPVRVRVRPADP